MKDYTQHNKKWKLNNPEKCKAQKKRYILKHSKEIKIYMAQYMAQYRLRHREVVNALKRKPCLDCGVSYLPCVMEFDHVRGKKEFDIAFAVSSNKSIDLILKEIIKCDLVCANCHRTRTYYRHKLSTSL